MADSVRAKYSQFPRIRIIAKSGTSTQEVDIAAIKEQYLSGKVLTWAGFCRDHNYNPKSSKSDWFLKRIDLTEWKREWIKRKTGMDDDELTPEIITTRKFVATQRIKFVHDWNKTAQSMKAVFNYLFNQHVMDIAEDQRNALAIRAGQAQKKCKLGVEELKEFSVVAKNLKELEASSLLIESTSAIQQAQLEAQDEDEESPEIEVSTMGTAAMSSEESVSLLAGYFDQFERKEEPKTIEVKPDEAASSDQV